MSTTIPTYTPSTAGNVRASASLAAAGTDNDNIDVHTVWGCLLTVLNTPGGTVAATRGLKIEIFNRYGDSPTTAPTASWTYTLPSATASTAESNAPPIWLPVGYWNVKITNLDASNAVTVEITSDELTNLATT